jgi:hypothetical protein
MAYPILGIFWFSNVTIFCLKVETLDFLRDGGHLYYTVMVSGAQISHILGAAANIRQHHTKLVIWVTWCPGFVHPWS